MPNLTKDKDIQTLLIRLLDNDLNDAQRDILIEWSRQDPNAVRVYQGLLQDYAIIRNQIAGQNEHAYGSSLDSHFDVAVWDALKRQEKNAPSVELPPDEPQPEQAETMVDRKNPTKVSKLSLYTLFLSAAALLFLIAYAHLSPRSVGVEVGTLTDSLDVKWADSGLSIHNKDRIFSNQPFYLAKGIVSILTDQGVALTIEGPAGFELMPNADLQLDFGRAYARVSPQGIGFTVNAPNSKIIDLGTEFGIQAEVEGEIELHVYDGKTTLVSGSSWLAKSSQTVLQEQARRIASDGGRIEEIPIRSEAFVRSIHSETNTIWRGQGTVSLADLVGGGNGLGGGVRGSCIDPQVGMTAPLTVFPGDRGGPGYRTDDTEYKPVLSSSYIDGIFVPNGRNGPIEISSAGHVFEGAPVTTGEYWYGVINWEAEKGRSIVLDGILYGTAEQPALLMHSNLGITFDLHAIRQSFPDRSITEFRAVYGISDSYANKLVQPYADFWILVDGELRFSRRNVTIHQAETVTIPLSDSDQFLTLVTTEGPAPASVEEQEEGPRYNDWCVWGNPVLKIE